MRLQRSKRLQDQWYTLPPEVRGFVNSLKANQTPEESLTFDERPNYREFFISGWWVGWTVDNSTGETLIIATLAYP